jgi:hypothetical protein
MRLGESTLRRNSPECCSRRKVVKFATKSSLLVACVSVSLSVVDTGAPAAAASDARSSAPLLRVQFRGGFGGGSAMDPDAQPTAVIDAAGRLLRPVKQTTQPLPSLIPYSVTSLSKQDLAKIVSFANAAGLSKKVDAGIPPTGDAQDLVIEFKGVRNVIVSYGFGDQSLPAPQTAIRKKIGTLISTLEGLPQGSPSTPAAVVIHSYNYARHDPDPGKTHKPQAQKAWPAQYAPLDGSCVVMSGPSASAAIKALQSSNVLTPWTSDGNVWRIVARPALAGDPGCNAG